MYVTCRHNIYTYIQYIYIYIYIYMYTWYYIVIAIIIIHIIIITPSLGAGRHAELCHIISNTNVYMYVTRRYTNIHNIYIYIYTLYCNSNNHNNNNNNHHYHFPQPWGWAPRRTPCCRRRSERCLGSRGAAAEA